MSGGKSRRMMTSIEPAPLSCEPGAQQVNLILIKRHLEYKLSAFLNFHSYLKLYTVIMSHWYQMNNKVFLNTALSAQLPCLAGLSL